MENLKDKVSFILVVLAYLLFNLRYAPGRGVDTLTATALQLLSTAPFAAGCTIFTVAILQRVSESRPPWDRVVRIFCTYGILIGFIYALYEHASRGQGI